MFIAEKMPLSVSAEAYRNVKTNIKYSSVDKKTKTILVTSSLPGEGKSTTAGNLAFVLAENEERVLVIDCDLRKPALHKLFKVSKNEGLTDILIDKREPQEVIRKVNKYVDLLTCGTKVPNPSEVVGSNALTNLIDNMAEIYDYIIIDSPPVLAVSDAQVLSTKCDGTILVVRSNKTKEKVLKRSCSELSRVNANIIGTVLNDYKLEKKYGYYKYYGE
ncbi:CpsD/CapB family tyrosine-protein kinase [Clostridium celatum]|uniref:non-specific protein-tyrosine kinase n=1 Tax=Clostridium celatum DSM 1785 TaxID=545697 RepID=L1QPC3_9CLOT|nr:CpsD/CapB family tyrosine-protein kinase [Clostridium celatum]EKY29823.1 capsular exopolysaccharide family protein [Clostridium celatum DSM 1785]MCE9656387.1 CpsD/CapB family tyrosine-protein kinase [Clostridium celatum]MDU2265502.1 CpsD/CapB family tyrosine-protein kinase [Clostridium celatum]MDU6295344.1 CpsD/CapB family tyrosine-protein kinase [Clostridium celatum]MDY3360800.1 CpsD/CapB family tyrosine-protein kinase [Clostridium celatum]